MNNKDFIRETQNLVDRFFAEWIELNRKREKAIEKDEMDLKNDGVIAEIKARKKKLFDYTKLDENEKRILDKIKKERYSEITD